MAELYKKLENYRDSDAYPFHMPGHKRNMAAAPEALAGAYGIDITEIDGFDNLHQSEDILMREQKRAADICGADKTYFLINGSTGGILSAIASTVKKGGRLLMARNCHKSVYHGAYLQELEVGYLYPEICEGLGIAGVILPDEVEKGLKENPGADAVIITSPTYEGMVSDIERIADVCHKYGKPLIVDEAHGAHFGLHPEYPESAIKLGADIVIQSLHKTLPSMTQTALLHVKGTRIDKRRLERYLRIFQSSSPSYVLMASISSCLEFMEREGRERLDQLLVFRKRLIDRLEPCRYIRAAGQEGNRTAGMDPCKLVIGTSGGRFTGRQLYDILRDRYHLQMEMAAGNYVLAILTVMDTMEGLDRLADALLEIDHEIAAERQMQEPTEMSVQESLHSKKTSVNEIVFPIFQAYDMDYESIALEGSRGHIAAEFINLYPPGIPLVVPGEKINGEIVRQLISYMEKGFPVQGVENGFIKVIRTTR